MQYQLNDYPRLPEDLVCVTTYFTDEEEYQKEFGTHHYAMDMAYTNRWKGGVKYIYAAADGVIKWRQNATQTAANALRIEHYGLIDGKTVHTRYFHMESIAEGMTVGKEVKKGDILGVEGKTGNATGPHLHFEFLICPTDYKFKSADVPKYAADPLLYCYLYPDQNIGHDPKNEVRALPETEYMKTELQKGTIFRVLRDRSLYYRSAPEIKNETRVGFLPAGDYEAHYTVENDGYSWVNITKDGETVFAAIYDELSFLVIPDSFEALYNEEKAKNAVLTEALEKSESEKRLLSEKLSEIKAALDFLKSV